MIKFYIFSLFIKPKNKIIFKQKLIIYYKFFFNFQLLKKFNKKNKKRFIFN